MEAVEYRESPESRLIQECKKGTPAAFDELIRRHQDTVFSLCYRLLGDHDEAADLSQEVFLNCFRKIKSFRGRRNFLPGSIG